MIKRIPPVTVKPRILGDDHGNGEPPARLLALDLEFFLKTHTPRNTQEEEKKPGDHQKHADPIDTFDLLHSGPLVAMKLLEAWRPVENNLKDESNTHHHDVNIIDPSCRDQLSNIVLKKFRTYLQFAVWVNMIAR
jgi:hypothetical protein